MRLSVLIALSVLWAAPGEMREARADSSADTGGDRPAGDPVMGKRLFAQCTSCHSANAGGPNRIGPNLHGIIGRKAASVAGFDYSEALRNSGIVWGERELDEYLKKPSAFVPGTRMVFLGIAKDQARADIIAHLKEATRAP